MKEIKGILCVAELGEPIEQKLLFGPDTSGTRFCYDRFITNNLTPFTDLACAQKALIELEKHRAAFGFVSTSLAEVKLQITDSDDEIKLIETEKNFIIVAEIENGEMRLLGQKVDDIPGVCYAPVSDLELNGFLPMTTLVKASNQTFGALYEVRRQGQVRAHLATFSLIPINS